MAMAAIAGGIGLLILLRGLPDVSQLSLPKKQHGIRVVSEDGTLIATYGDIYGETLTYDAMPKPLLQAVLATEDRRFFRHGGVDAWGILRALAVNTLKGKVVQGGSTITQQLAKNLFLTPERTLKRKLQEAFLAFALERRYGKREILAIYLNRVYLGAGSYGVDAAARRYFNKGARQLNVGESALLAGLLKAPSRYAPTANSKRAKDRAYQVLLNMEDAGYLREKHVVQAMAQVRDSLARHVVEGSGSRYFTDWIVDSLPQHIGRVDADLVVTTTLDPRMQRLAEDAVTSVMATEGPAKNIRQASLVAMSADGAVRAMVGGINYGSSQYNRAVQAKRQAGSTFKLFVYLAALERGFTPQSRVLDAPITLRVGNKDWSPQNFSGKYEGDISLAQAARESINTAAVRISQSVGPYRVASMARRLGIAQAVARPSIALGAEEVSLLELTGAFAHLPNGGKSTLPYAILSITTTGGEALYKRPEKPQRSVLDEAVVEQMNYLLKRVVSSGTGRRAAVPGHEVAGKTGTGQDYKDAWFVGYAAPMAAGVWVGNDDNSAMQKVTGGSVPALIWQRFMQQALADLPATPLPEDDGSRSFFDWFSSTPDVPADSNAESPPIPASAPFGLAHPDAGAPTAPPSSAFEVLEESSPERSPPPPAGDKRGTSKEKTGEPEILGKQFWNQLLNEASQEKLEYRYPDGR